MTDRHPFAELFLRLVREADEDRPRSRQSAQGVLGFSDAAGPECVSTRTLAGAARPNADQLVNLAAYVGTAFHESIARDVAVALPWATVERRVELPLPSGPLPGSADLVEDDTATDTTTVTDWKSSTVAALKGADGDGGRWAWPRAGHIEQVNGYAAALIAEGATLGRVRVRIVGVPREGDATAVRVWEADYAPEVAERLAQRVERVRATVSRGELAEPGRPAGSWCARFCPYYAPGGDGSLDGGCPGLPDKPSKGDTPRELTDDELTRVLAYEAARRVGTRAEDERKALGLALEGVVGTSTLPDGTVASVSWSPVNPSDEVDVDAVARLLEPLGLDVPTRPGKPRAPRMNLTVKTPKRTP